MLSLHVAIFLNSLLQGTTRVSPFLNAMNDPRAISSDDLVRFQLQGFPGRLVRQQDMVMLVDQHDVERKGVQYLLDAGSKKARGFAPGHVLLPTKLIAEVFIV